MPENNSITIGLNMIVKNEEKVLPRLFESIYRMIDWYTIVDTGSTDNTKKTIKEFFDSKGIKGEIHDKEWINFSDARNHALKMLGTKATIGFWIDADEEFILPNDFDKEKFKKYFENADVVNSMVRYGGTQYARNNFFRTSKPFYWEGPAHELLQCRDTTRGGNIPNEYYVLVHPDGNSWTQESQKEKYKKHVKLFLDYMRENKREDPRSKFYLAQSYKDCGYKNDSIKWYKKRRDDESGFFEERYWSQYQIARLKAELEVNDAEVISEFLRCTEFDILRAEHFVGLISFLQKKNRWEAAYIFSSHAFKYHKKNPYPTRLLFITPSVYENDIKALHTINCHNTGRSHEITLINRVLPIEELHESLASGWKGHKEFAHWLIGETNPNTIVELGVDYGYSLIALALPKIGKVYGIDNFNGDHATGFRNTEQSVSELIKILNEVHKIDNIEIIKGNFNDIASTWDKEIDIIHFDGLNTYEAVKNDYEVWSKFLNENSVMLFHNTDVYDTIKKFYNELNLPKIEFKYSGGLGVVSRNQSLIDKIKAKYVPQPVQSDITIAYISHNKEVYEKCLQPSIKNLTSKYEEIKISDELKPAENYNKLIEQATNKYILFVHEDVTFSPDLLERISSVISNYPDFGVIGAVGQTQDDIYHWSEEGKIKEVQILDCCCILINKDHNLKFDNNNFDDFHLYVEDYCMQVQKILGKKCYTIPVKASEAEKDAGYELKDNYFKHHSHTVNERGYCWGRWQEYKTKLVNKWNNYAPQITDEVDVCIISNAKDEELRLVTERGIISLLESDPTIKFNVFVVESNTGVNYDNYKNTTTIYPEDKDFGYHKYLNLAVSKGKSPYVVLCNNDLTYEKAWASEIIKQMKNNPDLLSASPLCPQIQKETQFESIVNIGWEIRRQLAGWCIFQQRKIYDQLIKLDERYKYWYSDVDYGMELQTRGIQHALITKSVVNHHDGNHGITGNKILGNDQNLANEYTAGQRNIFEEKWNTKMQSA